MNKPIAIIAGEPNSISSEIIFKTWKLRKTFRYKPFFIVGSFDLLNFQKKKLKYSIKLKKIDEKFKIGDLKGKELPILNINYTQKKAFEKISSKSSNYIFECFNETLKLIKKKKHHWFYKLPCSKRIFI